MKETRFKQTEIGLIPEDWSMIHLKVLADSYIGLTYSPQNISKQGILVLRSSNILDNFIILDDCVYVNCNIPSRCIVKENDILVCVRNGSSRLIGKSALIPSSLEGKAFGAFMSILRPLENNSFLFYVWQSAIIQKQIKENLGATINQITNRDIENYHIICPKEKTEREKIASALTSIDNLLLSLDKLIEKKKLIKQGAIQELLTGKKRLPGFTGEWIERCLGEIGEIVKDSINPQLYRAESFFEYSMPAYDLNKQPEIKYGEEMFSNRTKISGTILLYNKLNVRQRRVWYIEDCKYRSICSMEFLPYKVHSDYLKFFYYKLSIDSVINYFIGISKGTSNSQKRISPNDFLDLKVSYPKELQEQKAIVSVLSSMDKEIDALEGKRAKYEQIKQGMMQQLLTGKIRLI